MNRIIRFLFIPLATAALVSQPLSLTWSGSFSSSSKGTTVGNFLKLGAGARALSMGEAFSAVADDATALYWNPANLNKLNKRSLSLMHSVYLESSFYDYGSYAQPLSDASSFGLGIQYFSAGKIIQRDVNGYVDGSFTPNDLALSAGYAHTMGPYSAGVSAKYIRSEIVNSAQTAAIDFGVLSPSYFDRFTWAFNVKNLGGKMKFDEEAEPLPLSITLGSAFHWTDRVLTSLDVIFPKDNQPTVAMGGEYLIPFGRTTSWALRAGYNSRTLGDVDGVTGLTLGAGFKGQALSIDYGFILFGEVGASQVFSISTRF